MDVERLVREGVEVFNEADWGRVPDLVTDDYVYTEVGTGRRVEGASAWTELAQGWRDAFPDARGEVLRLLVSGDECAIQVRWTGTQSGPLQLGEQALPPSGRRVEVLGMQWVRVRDGRIAEQHHHLDVLTLLTQLGALPAPTPV